jgi:hypothetical protein
MSNSMSKNIWVEREMILSPTFRKLNGTAKTVLFLFLYRRQWEKSGRNGKPHTTNNGQIVFPYKEAKKRFNISKSSFARAIDSLIENGFIDIAHLGGGLIGDCTKYSISHRWKDYGTNNFKEKRRPKDTRGFGFTQKNWEAQTGKKRRKNSNLGINFDSGISSKNDTSKKEREAQLVSKMIQGNLDVNFFMTKGEQVFQALSQSHPQNCYRSISSHTN